MRPMRVKVYEIQDELNQLDQKIFKIKTEQKLQNEIRDQLKVIRKLLNAL